MLTGSRSREGVAGSGTLEDLHYLGALALIAADGLASHLARFECAHLFVRFPWLSSL
jgi:hypothetical protein